MRDIGLFHSSQTVQHDKAYDGFSINHCICNLLVFDKFHVALCNVCEYCQQIAGRDYHVKEIVDSARMRYIFHITTFIKSAMQLKIPVYRLNESYEIVWPRLSRTTIESCDTRYIAYVARIVA